uniref:TELO2 interacting protein 2 n=1 Tax=Hippocampus comes TaxID=109280 RepID=A0A3Q2X8F8_HIPCM
QFACFQERSWTSRASREASRGLESQLLAAGGWRDSAHMLTGGGPDAEAGILGAVLDVLQPALMMSLRAQVQRPFLASLLPRLLGPALLLSDHHDANKCMLGIRCLHHIVSNTAASELRALNRADVMYDALFKHLHAVAHAQLVLSCLLDLLAVLESAPSAAVPPAGSVANRRTACRHDDVLRLLLTRMEAEHKVALRRVYAQALSASACVFRMGVCACRHFGRLSRVLPAYLEVSDAPEELTRLDTLEALQQLFTAAWPSVDVWLPCLLRLLVDASSEPSLRHDVGRQLSRRAARCLALLDAAAHGHLQVPICPRVTC